jgi:predicted house-cleaning noncanonical NTP pyrophosphatase (MazG superfamily)
MNKLEQQIWDRYGNFELSHDKNKLIVENINEFIEKHCKAFADFIETNKQYLHYWKSKYTTEELFKLYKTNL